MNVRFDCDAPGERPSRSSAGQAAFTNFLSDGFRVWRDIGRDDVQSLGEELRGPARADDAGADDGDAANWLVVGHVSSPIGGQISA